MNIQQINDNIQIKDFLEKVQIYPKHQRGDSYWYISPIREPESTPSFKVDNRRNRWYDFALGEGGKLFDLARKLYQSDDISSIIGKVTDLFLLSKAKDEKQVVSKNVANKQQRFSRGHTNRNEIPTSSSDNTDNNNRNSGKQKHQSESSPDSPKIIIELVEPLGKSYAMVRYLNQRGISKQTARHYCKEVSFNIGDKTYSAIGFENRSGGYELRNDWFKGSSSPKDISFIANGSNAVCLVEGFMDFLSLVELGNKEYLNANFLVLNSVALLPRSIEILKSHHDVFLFLDHDKAGKEAAKKLVAAGINSIDSSGFYQGFKDVNEYLVSLQPTQEVRQVRRR